MTCLFFSGSTFPMKQSIFFVSIGIEEGSLMTRNEQLSRGKYIGLLSQTCYSYNISRKFLVGQY